MTVSRITSLSTRLLGMSRRTAGRVAAVAIAVALSGSDTARCQDARGLIAPAELARFGLERMWFTHLAVDSTRGHVVQWKLHVHSTESVTVYEVAHGSQKYRYRETDVDSLGRILGKERAKKLAEVKLSDLKALQMAARPSVQSVPRMTLYAATDSGRVHAVDAETGRSRWKASVGNPNYPTLGVDANDGHVAAVNGSRIFLLKGADGELIWERRTNGAPGAPPALSETMAFVPMINGAMEAYPLDATNTRPAIFRSHGQATVVPTFTGTNVAWPTDRGHLYVSAGDSNRIIFRLEAKDGIVSPATFLPPSHLLVSSVDGFVYCLDQSTGVLQWRFSAGEPIVNSPVPYGDTVFVVTVDGTLFALDASLGQEKWTTTQVGQVIGASQQRLYCLSDINRLTILDRASGAHLGSLSTELDDLAYVNLQTDRILIGTTSGVVQCLREAGQDLPLLHIPLRKPETPQAKRPVRRKAEAPQPSEPDAANPFGGDTAPAGEPSANPFEAEKPTPAGGDPFGAGPAGEATPPAEAPEKPSDNPFG